MDLVPQLRPYQMTDNSGVHIVCGVVLRTLDPRQNATHINYNSISKMRSFFSNFANASLHGTGSNFVLNEGTSSRVSNAATNSVWFQRFMEEIHQQMDPILVPNRALNQYKLTDCFQILGSNEWDAAQEHVDDKFRMKCITMTACILLSGYFTSLPGE